MLIVCSTIFTTPDPLAKDTYMELNDELLRRFKDGHIEVRCENTKTTHRGRIATAAVTGTGEVNRKLTVTLSSFAKRCDGESTWVVEPYAKYTAGLMVYYAVTDIGDGRVYLTSDVMSELVVLYPPDDALALALAPVDVIGLNR